jgi:hypothetical protein
MGTKRELRASKNLEPIIRILRPFIDRHLESLEREAHAIVDKQIREQAELK